MTITNSPDLGALEVKIAIDLSGTTPVINLTNQTTANPNVSPTPTLNDIEWVLNIYSPTGTPILQSSFTSPWKTGVWTTEQITNPWPQPFGQIEWSGGDYLIQFQVKDSAGNIYDLFKEAKLCRPSGNTKNTPNTYGASMLTVETMCDTAQLYIRDTTSKSYQGITGVLASSYLAVDYPRDSTGVRPAAFEITSFVTDALVPFTYNGRGYEVTYYSIYTYDLGDNVFVTIRYTAQVSFDVTCNIDLCPLACEVKALEESIQSGRCADIEEAQAKLNLITPKLLRAFIAKANPTCGIGLAALVEEIKSIGGFSCDCYGASTGIGTSGIVNNFNFAVNNQGGDVIGSWSVTGNNVTLNLKDKSYTFGPSSGASILLVPTTSGTNTDVQLQVSINDLASDIYTATANSTTLLNMFNALVINGGFKLEVDGRCVINNGACDFEWLLSGIPTSSAANALMVFVRVNGVMQPLSFAFNTTTVAALQTYLNGLGLGTFVVTDEGSGNVKITSASNSFGLTDFVYTPNGSSPKQLAVLTKDCSGFVSYTPDEIVQAIIDYLCELDDSQVLTSQAYDICWIDPDTNTEKTETVAAGTPLTDFIITLLEKGCSTISYIINRPPVTCSELQAIFSPSEQPMQANDFVMGTKAGDCARIYPVELGGKIFELGIFDATFMAAFAVAIELNAGGKMCDPYSVFNLSTAENSPFDNQMDITVTFTHPEAISNTIRYARIDLGGTLDWTTITGVLPGASPYTISNVDEGQYTIGITPVYADGRKCGEVTKNTTSCSLISSFAATFDGTNINVTYSAVVSVPKVRLVINYPNGGQFSQIYNNGATISVVPPSELTGTYSLTLQSVCNEANGWFGVPTAPAIIEVSPASNSSVINDTSADITNFKVWYVDTNNVKVVVINVPTFTAGQTLEMYIPDGYTTGVTLSNTAGSLGSGTLDTDTGVISGVMDGLGRMLFADVTVLNGVVITLIDSSP